MKVLIVGASSFIGLRLFGYLEGLRQWTVTGTYCRHKKDERFLHLDITKAEEIESVIGGLQPDAIVWVAGTKNIKQCEEDFEYAKTINTYPLQALLGILNRKGLNPHILFISTDYVFDGKRGRYADSDEPNPQTNYGRSNLMAERYLQQSPLACSIIRTSAVMGRDGTFFSWLLNALRQNQKVELFSNVYYSPTPIVLLLQSIQCILEKKIEGCLHVCGNRRISRYEFGCEIKKLSPSFVADLVPSQADLTHRLFQEDLSLEPSARMSLLANSNLIEDLRGEI